MNINLQLVVLGLIVSQGICLNAMENTIEERRVAVKHPVNKVEKGAKRQCLNLSAPSYIVVEKRDWATELKKNPRLAWLPI